MTNTKLVAASTMIFVLQLLTLKAEAQYYDEWDPAPQKRTSCIDKSHSGCISATAAAVAGGAGGIFAFKKYSTAKVFDKSNTKVLFDSPSHPATLAGDRINSLTRDVMDGDRVAVRYRLSEQANRQHHVDILESNADSSRSSASSHRSMSMMALIPRTETEYYTDHNGEQKSRTVTRPPDLASHLLHKNLAEQADRDARQYMAQANQTRRGGPVPWYEFDEIIAGKAGNRADSIKFLSKNSAEKGSILSLTRLPAAQFKQLRALVWKARGGVAVAAAGSALMVEELFVGKLSAKLTGQAQSSQVRTLTRGSFSSR